MSEAIRISIGSEPQCFLPAEVLKSSIARRTLCEVRFGESYSGEAGIAASVPGRMFFYGPEHGVYHKGWHPLMRRGPQLKRGTKFSAWRWHVPAVYRHEGRAIYLDSDQVVLADIAELWDALEPGSMLAAVCNVSGGDYWGFPTTIRDAGKRYRGKIQTSVMVMDCAACDWDFGQLAREHSYADLMQGEWLDRARIQPLDPQWNRFGRLDEGTKLLHWSHVGTQPWKPKGRGIRHPTADVWREELAAALEAGHIAPETLRGEIEQGHVHRSYGGLL